MRRFTLLAAAGLAAAALAMSLTSTASARTLTEAKNLCPNGQICLFDDTNFNGEFVHFQGYIRYLDYYNFEDRASSYVNDSGVAFCLYETGNFNGSRYYVPSAGYSGYYSTWMSSWSDRVSSLSDMTWGMRCT